MHAQIHAKRSSDMTWIGLFSLVEPVGRVGIGSPGGPLNTVRRRAVPVEAVFCGARKTNTTFRSVVATLSYSWKVSRRFAVTTGTKLRVSGRGVQQFVDRNVDVDHLWPVSGES
jgi:hypothetical protein